MFSRWLEKSLGLVTVALSLGLFATSFMAPRADAATAQEIDASVNAALERFKKDVKGADEFLNTAKGILVLPGVIKAGVGIGGEYGEGALRIHGKTVAYYSIASGSIGFQLGAQKKDVFLVFMTEPALQKFRDSNGWEVGVDGSVAFLDLGAGASITTKTIKDPIVGFVIGQKGLMYNLTLEGSKLTKLNK